MKREQSTAGRSLKAVSLVITLVSVVAFSTIAYSGYVDVNDVLRNSVSGVTGKVVQSGSDATAYLNVTVRNDGFYPLGAALSCIPGEANVDVTCAGSNITVPMGQTGVLHFSMTLHGASQIPGGLGNLHVNGTLSASLEPFAYMSAKVDLGALLGGGGG